MMMMMTTRKHDNIEYEPNKRSEYIHTHPKEKKQEFITRVRLL